MKKLILSLIVVLAITNSCNSGSEKTQEDPSIYAIENNLLPTIVVEGSDPVKYNIHERMDYYNVPGVSIAFIDQGELVWAKGYGHLSSDSKIAVDENTVFQAASISKPVAAMAALSMVEEGLLELDNNVNDYLVDWQIEENEFTENEKVTLRRLLTHSAGLTVHGFPGYSYKADLPTTVQILDGESPANTQKIYPNINPGEIYRYSGGGYTVMQKILSDISGKTFPELMQERVISKIGMTNSTYMQPLPESFHSNAAIAHNAQGEMIEGKWHTYPEMAAAGLWTTPTDLLKYALEVQKSYMEESNKVLSSDMVKEMLSIQIGSQGLGPAVRKIDEALVFSHGGSNNGYRCIFMAFADKGQGVAIMTNGDNGAPLGDEIMRSFSDIYDWPIYQSVKKLVLEMDSVSLAEFVGKYKYDQRDLVVDLSIKDNHLSGKQIWDDFTFEIFAESELKFFNKDDGSPFEFIRNEEGKVVELIVQRSFRFVKID